MINQMSIYSTVSVEDFQKKINDAQGHGYKVVPGTVAITMCFGTQNGNACMRQVFFCMVEKVVIVDPEAV